MENGLTGYDFYVAVMKGAEVHSVEHVRLYGPSDAWISARAPVYERDGFTLRPSSYAEYRARNWRKAA